MRYRPVIEQPWWEEEESALRVSLKIRLDVFHQASLQGRRNNRYKIIIHVISLHPNQVFTPFPPNESQHLLRHFTCHRSSVSDTLKQIRHFYSYQNSPWTRAQAARGLRDETICGFLTLFFMNWTRVHLTICIVLDNPDQINNIINITFY